MMSAITVLVVLTSILSYATCSSSSTAISIQSNTSSTITPYTITQPTTTPSATTPSNTTSSQPTTQSTTTPTESSGEDLYFMIGVIILGMIILAVMTGIFVATVLYLFRRKSHGRGQTPVKYNRFENKLSVGDLSIQEQKQDINTHGFEKEFEPGDKIPSVNPIRKEDFQKYVKDKDIALHTQEFSTLYTGQRRKATVAFNENNRKLNRFKNIVPFDRNRVQLKDLAYEDCTGDYINASHIDGYSVQKKFIASQGPTAKTVIDFIRMIWLEQVHIIVMVTNLWEGGRSKCEQYWPSMSREGTGESRDYGPFSMKLTSETAYPDYTIRTMEIEFENESREVTQYQLTTWPDHGVLEHPLPLILVHKRVVEKWQRLGGPILVHCSAGVGRTGTFIAMDIALEQVNKEEFVDIAGIVTRLRQQRIKMVQTEDQYKFVHDAVLDALICGDTEINSNQFVSKLKELKQSKVLESEFSLLAQVTPGPDEVIAHSATSNPDKNRSTKYLPADKNLVGLPRGQYINAIFARAYGKLHGMIIAQSPMQNTVTEFWKMIIQHKVPAVVMCCDLMEEGKDACFQYWKGLNQPIVIKAQFRIMKTAETNENGFIRRTFGIKSMELGNSEWIVEQFHIKWPPNGVVNKPDILLNIIQEVAMVQSNAGGGPIVVHCSDTVSRSGVYCAVSNTIEQYKAEGVVDVFQTVKTLRMNKPGAVTTLDQYTSIHDTVSYFLKSS